MFRGDSVSVWEGGKETPRARPPPAPHLPGGGPASARQPLLTQERPRRSGRRPGLRPPALGGAHGRCCFASDARADGCTKSKAVRSRASVWPGFLQNAPSPRETRLLLGALSVAPFCFGGRCVAETPGPGAPMAKVSWAEGQVAQRSHFDRAPAPSLPTSASPEADRSLGPSRLGTPGLGSPGWAAAARTSFRRRIPGPRGLLSRLGSAGRAWAARPGCHLRPEMRTLA